MKLRNLLVSGTVGVVCLGILVVFTEIEDDLVKWINCGPIAAGREHQSRLCR